MTYTIYKHRLEELEKAYRRLATKARAIGLDTSMTTGEPYFKKVTVCKYDDIAHAYIDDHETTIEVVDIELTYPDYKLGDYELIAILDHTLSTRENAVYKYKEAAQIPTKYRTAPATCEHCKTTRKRNSTALIQDATGNIKQIGIDCLKEYTGIQEADIIRAFVALDALFAESNSAGLYTGGGKEYVDTLDYIAECIHIIRREGYSKGIKTTAFDAVHRQRPEATAADKETAQKVLDYFRNGNFDDDFLHNIHMNTLKNATLENGLLAYSYTAYQKEMEKAERKAARDAENAKYNYYGAIGDKIKVAVTGRVVSSYLYQISYYNTVRTFIYEFRDSENHVFIWKSQKEIEIDESGVYHGTITGTIKEHNEFNGVKQTVLTRCRV